MTESTTAPRTLTLLPPAPDVCQECASVHAPDDAHNAQSLYYHKHFHRQHRRFPTWRDAMAHLDPVLRDEWEAILLAAGADLDGVP